MFGVLVLGFLAVCGGLCVAAWMVEKLLGIVGLVKPVRVRH